MGELLDILLFRAGYNTAVVVLGSTLLGLAAGVVGALALLRKRALMGDTLAHATLPGIAAAFLVATALRSAGWNVEPKSLPVLLLGATVAGVLGVLAVQAIRRHTRLTDDAAMGIVLSTFFGAGFVLLSYIQTMPTGNQAGLKTFIYGMAAAMNARDAALMAAVAAAAAVVALLLFKEFRIVAFDEASARVQGWPVTLLDLVLMGLVVAVTVIGLQAVGLIMVIALLITPAAAARFWTDRLSATVALSAAIGGLSGYAGAAASAMVPRLPAGAVIVLVVTAIFLLGLVFAPRHGLVAVALRRRALSRSVRREHILRAAYEAAEAAGVDPGAPVPLERVRAARSWSPAEFARARALVEREGLARFEGDRSVLSEAGVREAARAVRNHRLWEEFLVTHADIAPSHVDRAADLVEHVLSPELVHELESAVVARGELPPPSVHPIAPARPGAGGAP
jgi:manganese/zinc/iron transport system permease protein